jgi:hypothetical protein
MARLAATEHGADWVINSDADEFWWPREGSLKDVLGAVPAGFGVVRAFSRQFFPTLDDTGDFAERLRFRVATTAPINDPVSLYRPVVKVAHRADPRVSVGWGNHHVYGLPFALLRDWHPLELLHMPFRSRSQCVRKYAHKSTHAKPNLRGDFARSQAAAAQGRPESAYDRVAVDDATLRRGLAAGTIVQDTRLRDALRTLRAATDGPRQFVVGTGRAAELFLRPSPLDEAGHAVDAAVLEEADEVRMARVLDALEGRVAALDGGFRARFRRARGSRSPASPTSGSCQRRRSEPKEPGR